MKSLLITILVSGSIVAILVNWVTVCSIKKLLIARELLEKVDLIEDPKFNECYAQLVERAEPKGFKHDIKFNFHINSPADPIKCGALWSEHEKMWVLLYVTTDVQNIDFVKIYEGGVGVTTASTKDSVMLPNHDKAYIQSFTGLSFDDQYSRQLSAVKLIEQTQMVEPLKSKPDLLSQIEHSMSQQAHYIMSLLFWQCRGIFWYFIRRNTEINKPIKVRNA